jgi:cytochrome c-type biogenesis protein CcmH/NrfG
MAEIGKVLQLVKNDSTNVFALTVLGEGAIMTGQYDVAIKRFGEVVTLQPANLKAILRIAEAYEKKADIANAIKWYSNALPLVANNPNMKTALENRIQQLKK